MAKHALVKLSHELLPLTAFQIHSMLSVAPVDQLGSIKYTQLVPVVTRTLQQVCARFQWTVRRASRCVLCACSRIFVSSSFRWHVAQLHRCYGNRGRCRR